MNDKLPEFRYHPNPIQTGAIRPGSEQCACCGRTRGYIYTGPVYAEDELRNKICPWCLSDGSAATKLGASFADVHSLFVAGVPSTVAEEVNLRTPSYVSWQGETWLAHCGDACEFHGDASLEDLEGIVAEAKATLIQRFRLGEDDWTSIKEHYKPGGDPALYKFVCRHCGITIFGMDYS